MAYKCSRCGIRLNRHGRNPGADAAKKHLLRDSGLCEPCYRERLAEKKAAKQAFQSARAARMAISPPGLAERTRRENTRRRLAEEEWVRQWHERNPGAGRVKFLLARETRDVTKDPDVSHLMDDVDDDTLRLTTNAPDQIAATTEVSDLEADLARLTRLRDDGIITPEEHDAKRRQILGL